MQLCKKKIALPAEDCTPEEVHEEFAPLSALLSKLLNAPLVPVRHVAQAVYFTVARAVWASGSHPARELLASEMKGLFHTYATKKNTRIAQKFIEDLLVNRLSDIAVPLVWSDLVEQLGEVQHSFLRSELVHLFLGVVKKYHGLAVEAQQAVRAEFARGLTALTAQLTALVTDSDSGKSGKKIKAFLSGLKDVTDFLKKATAGAEGAAKEGAKVVRFEDVTATREAVQGLQSTLAQVLEKVSGGGAEGAAEEGKSDKKGNKQSGLSGQVAAVQAALTAFLTATEGAARAAEKSMASAVATPAGKGTKDKGAKTPAAATLAPAVVATPAVDKTSKSKTEGDKSGKKRAVDMEAEAVATAEKPAKSSKKEKKEKR